MEQAQCTGTGAAGANSPGLERKLKMVNNPGNPVATCTYPPDVILPKIRGQPVLASGYGGKPQNPMYTTTANSYGSKAPSIYTVPTQFFARSQKFSGHLGVCGMYRNYSLNTEVDKSQI